MRLRKREKAQGNLLGKAIRNPMVQYAGILSYAIMLLMRIPLLKVIGEDGVGLFAPAFEIFFLVTLFTSHAMTDGMTGMIRYRVKREQFKSAKKVFRAAFFMDLIVSAAAGALLLLFSGRIASAGVLEPLCRMALAAAAPTLILSAFIGTFRGYFNGFGLGVLTAHSRYIESVTMGIGAVLCSGLFYEYGLKVAALKQNPSIAYAYGALGAVLGVMASQLLTTLHLLFMYVIYAGTLRGRLGMDPGRRLETSYSLQLSVLENSAPFALVAVLSNLFMLVDQRMFNHCMNSLEAGGRTAQWGSYYGKFAVIVGVCTVFCVLSCYGMAGRIGSAYEREEYRVMRDRIAKAMRRLTIVSFPAAVYLAVLAKALTSVLFDGGNAAVVSWLQKGAVLIVLYSVCCLFGQLMYRIHMIRELLAATLLSLAVHIAAAYLLVQRAQMGADGVIWSLVIFFGIFAALNFFLAARSLKYRQEWIAGVVFPAAAAGVSGAAAALIGHLLLDVAGGGVTVLAGVLVGLFLYITLLMILRVIGEAELSRMPLGFFFIMLGKNIGVL